MAASGQPKVLPGTVPDIVAHGQAQLLGHKNGTDSVGISIGLPLRNVQSLEGFLQDVNNPTGPKYHQFLTQDAANQEFNPTSDQEQRVTQWLQAHGLSVTSTYPNHLMITAVGSVTDVEHLLQISLNRYHATIRGQQHDFYAPSQDPVVDGSVSDVVQSIAGLDTVPRFHSGLASNGNAHNATPYYPQDIANAYDVGPLWSGGYTGTGQHIGITLWTVPPADTTLQHFGSTTGASVATVGNGKLKVFKVCDGTNCGSTATDTGEAGLDIEWSGAMAPGAVIDYYEAPVDSTGNPTGQGLLNALNQAGTDSNNNLQITNSWGSCEASSTSDPFTSQAENIFASNAATGHNYFFSSGDNGSWCDPNGTGVGQDPFPDYPASSPHVTAVGGTKFSATVNGKYPGEAAWTYCATCSSGSPEGSGGGYSNIFSQPTWQTGSGLSTGGKRDYPDVSALADPGTGVYACYGASSSCAQFGGTSLASPLWSGIVAVLNQYLVAQGKATLGFLDPTLYNLTLQAQVKAPFHDVTSGTNGKYNAGVAWDAVTGLGTPDAYNLAQDLGGVVSTPITSAAGTATIQAGAGWNMVGGSPLTLWSDSLVNWAFNASTPAWYHPTGTEAAGTGAWEEVSTAGPRTVTVQTCTGSVTVSVTAHRWNLVGNPCGAAVSLPSSDPAYWWNPSTHSYQVTSTINPGAAAWVKPDSSSVILTVT